MSFSSEFREQFAAALASLRARDLGSAAAICGCLLQGAPDDPAALQLLAAIKLAASQPREAREAIVRSLHLRPDHAPSLLLAARAERALGATQSATQYLRQAVARAPGLPDAAFLLCHVLLELHDPAVDAEVARTLERHPSHSAALLELGLALRGAGRKAQAFAAFTQAARADSGSASARYGCGLLLRDSGRLADARVVLEQATILDSAHAGAWFALGLTCQDLDDNADAAIAYTAALRAKPDFAEAAVNAGIALQNMGDLDAAMTAYRQALRIRPDTFGRIAQAITSARIGMLFIGPDDLRRRLAG